MIGSVQKTIVLADASKFGKKGFGKICDLEDVDQIITNKSASKQFITTLESKGIEVILV